MPSRRDIDRRVEALCETYERGLLEDESPDFSPLLLQADSGWRDELFRQLLLLKWAYEPPDASKEMERFPEFADVIEECRLCIEDVRQESFQPGDHVGRYVIKGIIGAGSFSDVYQAYDQELKRHVAIKSPKFGDHASLADVERFKAEAAALADLRHPNIVTIYDVISSPSSWPLIVMEFVPDRILDVGSDRDLVIERLIEVAGALHYAHGKGYIHRDLKPDNILIAPDGRALIADFGLAINADEQHAQRGKSAGTVKYMSPELVRGESHWVDGRSDIWSLGVILYLHLVGETPFQSDDLDALAEAILTQPAKPPRQSSSDCSERLEQICLKCLRKSPEERYPTAKDFADALSHARRHQHLAARFTKPAIVASAAVCVFAAGWLFASPSAFEAATATTESRPEYSKEIATGPKTSVPATIHLEISRRREGSMRWDSLPDAVPLRSGDSFSVTINVERPLRMWVYWLDSDAVITRLYPSELDDSVEPLRELRLPAHWSLDVTQSGSATLLVLGAPEKIDADVENELASWKPQAVLLQRPVHTDFGRLIARKHRGTLNYHEDPSLAHAQNQRLLQNDTFERFSLCRSICIPIKDSSSE